MTQDEFNEYLNLEIDIQIEATVLKNIAKAWKIACEIIRSENTISDLTAITDRLKIDFPNGLKDKLT